MQQRGSASDDWQRIQALAADGLGWEDIVVIMRKRAKALKHRPAWSVNEIRNYVLKGSKR